jgi:hypothetical protein
MLASRAVRWKFEFSVVRRRRPDAAGRHRAALGCGFEGWLEPVTAEAKVDCLPFRRNEGTTAVRKLCGRTPRPTRAGSGCGDYQGGRFEPFASCGEYGRRKGDELRQFPQVLGSGRQ